MPELIHRDHHETLLGSALLKESGRQHKLLADLLGWPPKRQNVPPETWQKNNHAIRDVAFWFLGLAFALSAGHLVEMVRGAYRRKPGANIPDKSWTIPPEEVATEAERYAKGRSAFLGDSWATHTEERVRDVVARAEAEEWTRKAFDESFKPIFDRPRIDTISVTETTHGTTGGEGFVRDRFQDENPGDVLLAIWRHRNKIVRGKHPCPLCAPLVGTAQNEWAAIDPEAIKGPPRHPNCDCVLEFQVISAGEAQRLQLVAPRNWSADYGAQYRRLRDDGQTGLGESVQHAPHTMTIGGKKFHGGEFIPGKVLAKATKAEKAELDDDGDWFGEKGGETRHLAAERAEAKRAKNAKSKAVIYFGDKTLTKVDSEEVEQRVAAVAKRLKLKPDTLVDLVGAPDDAEVRIGSKDDAIVIQIAHKDFTATRRVEKDEQGRTYIKNETFFVSQQAQGRGLGIDVFSRQAMSAHESGVAYIRCHAAKGADFNGYYTWPRFGYDAPLSQQPHFEEAREAFPNAKSILDIMTTKEGRDWWKANGTDIYEATFDLSDDSRSMMVMREYLKERGKLKESAIRGEDVDLTPEQEEAIERVWEKIEQQQEAQ